MTTTPPEAPSGGPSGPRVTGDQVRDLGRLRRSRSDRKVAGVAGGLARHLDIDPLILRVAFVVLVFFGGAGLILYGACWLLLPEDGTDRATIHLDERSRTVALLIVGVIAAAALIGDSWGAFWFPWPVAVVALIALWLLTRNNPSGAAPAPSAPPPPSAEAPAYAPAGPTPYHTQPVQPFQSYVKPTNPRKRGPILFWFTLALIAFAEGVLGIIDLAGANVAGPAYPALAVGICGAMLVLGAFVGRAGGIIVLGLVGAVVLAGATAASKIDTDTVSVAPTTAAAVRSQYSLDVGEQRIDLSRVADPAGLDGRTIHVDGDFGSIDVTVPEGLRVLVDARVHGPGDIKLFGDEHGGIDVEQHRTAGTAGEPTITLDLELSVGTIEVTR